MSQRRLLKGKSQHIRHNLVVLPCSDMSLIRATCWEGMQKKLVSHLFNWASWCNQEIQRDVTIANVIQCVWKSSACNHSEWNIDTVVTADVMCFTLGFVAHFYTATSSKLLTDCWTNTWANDSIIPLSHPHLWDRNFL